MRTRAERLAHKAAQPTLKERLAATDEKNAARKAAHAPEEAARAEQRAELAQERHEAVQDVKAAFRSTDESAGAQGPKKHFRYLGVIVQDGKVYWTALGHKTPLGPLAGAHCVVTGESSRHTLTRVVTVAGALTKKSQATAITVAGSQTHSKTVKTTGQVRAMEREAAQFNALAAACSDSGDQGRA